jgi:hypothetical protein
MFTRLETKNKGHQTDDMSTTLNGMCSKLEIATKGRLLIYSHIRKIWYNIRCMIICMVCVWFLVITELQDNNYIFCNELSLMKEKYHTLERRMKFIQGKTIKFKYSLK